MANAYHKNMPGKSASGGSVSGSAQGRSPESFSKQGTANWPGVPGKTQPRSRAGGAPTRGKMGDFYVKKQGL